MSRMIFDNAQNERSSQRQSPSSPIRANQAIRHHRTMSRRARIWMLPVLIAAWLASAQTNVTSPPPVAIRYAAIGDSYSNGEGATPKDAWPALLSAHLAASGRPMRLVANPSKTGWTTQQALTAELPLWKAAKPDFATLQIGVNDWVQGVDIDTFRQHLVQLLDAMLKVLPGTNRLLVVTIPDFSVTPTGAMYGGGRDIARGLTEFNQVILQESASRHLKVVDVFPLSQKMRGDSGLTAPDGLHPSAKEYAQWEQIIFPAAQELLSKSLP